MSRLFIDRRGNISSLERTIARLSKKDSQYGNDIRLAIRHTGIIEVAATNIGARVSFNPSITSSKSIHSLLYLLADLYPKRILLSHYTETWREELIPTFEVLVKRIEELIYGSRAPLPPNKEVENGEDLGYIYEDQENSDANRKIITDAIPRIILVNEEIIKRISREPQAIFDLDPRKFEEIVADLLSDLGYEVHLTPATRDGGKDLLAYMNTPLGRILCLVEAKRFRRDRPIGIGLIRQLYGTLIDSNANAAMMVSTSYYSRDAKVFEQKYSYRLSLKDFDNIISWINKYKKK